MPLTQALALQRSGDLQAAYELYNNHFTKSGHTSYPAAFGAGRCQGGLRDFEKAAYYFQHAARIAPDRFEPLLELANVQYRLKEYRRSLISIEAALAHTQETERINLLRIRMLNALGEHGQVLRLCDRVNAADFTPLQHYAWRLRRVRAHFHIGNLELAGDLASQMLIEDRDHYARWSNSRASDESASVDILLNSYQRPESVEFQRWWLEYQSVRVNRMLVWHNYGGLEFRQKPLTGAVNAVNDVNHMFYGRFAFALMSQAEFIAAFDDDTIPGTHWLRNCVDVFRARPALLGSIGVTLQQPDRYAPNTRTGWIGEGQEEPTEVDLVGHAWFLPRDWLRHFWLEKPSTFLTGEDMHLSFISQKHLGVATTVPAHPASCPAAWGSVLGEELGMDAAASSNQKGTTHYSERDNCVRDLVARGWNLKNV